MCVASLLQCVHLKEQMFVLFTILPFSFVGEVKTTADLNFFTHICSCVLNMFLFIGAPTQEGPLLEAESDGYMVTFYSVVVRYSKVTCELTTLFSFRLEFFHPLRDVWTTKKSTVQLNNTHGLKNTQHLKYLIASIFQRMLFYMNAFVLLRGVGDWR